MKNTVKTLNSMIIGITSLTAVTVFLLTALLLAGCPTEEETEKKLAVTIAAIQVTAPVIGETPVETITPNLQYTGTVMWVGKLADDDTFDVGITYTAIITLTATRNYTMDGVTKDFFTVTEAASVTNAADSGIVTATFAATYKTTISIAAIQGVTVPVKDGYPVSSITSSAEYTGRVAWTDASGGRVSSSFSADQVYTATITLTPKAAYTLDGVAANFFTVAGATKASYTPGNNIVTVTFPKAPTTIDIKNIVFNSSVTVPATGKSPPKTINSTAQYTGADVKWKNAAGDELTGSFAAGTEYIVTITLKEKTGFTFQGVPANFFKVEGATAVINSPNSGLVTVTFPATLSPINIKDIKGVTVPVVTEYPVGTITPTDQYTGVVSWKENKDGGKDLTGAFGEGVAYIATIILTPRDGYTFDGVAVNYFTVAGASSTKYAKESDTITAAFPATKKLITNKDIKGIYPVAGNAPVTDITKVKDDQENSLNGGEEYTGKVTWSTAIGNFTGSKFAENMAYSATITLTPKSEYTFERGVAANSFNVEMASLTSNQVNSNVITAVFPRTGGSAFKPSTVNITKITFKKRPVSGVFISDVTEVTETLQYTGGVTWDTNQTGVFDKNKPIKATITLTAKSGYTFTGIVNSDYFTVEDQQVGSTTNQIIPAVVPPNEYPSNDKITIQTTILVSDGPVTIEKIPGILTPTFPGTEGGTGEVVKTEITPTDQYTGTVKWYEKGNKEFLGKNFGPGMEYTAKIELKAKSGYTFTGVEQNFFKMVVGPNEVIDNNATVTNPPGNGTSIVVTVVYKETKAILISNKAITGVVLPKAGEIPAQIPLDNNKQFYAVITWASPSSPFLAGIVYGAIITVTPKPGYTLDGITSNFFTVAGVGTDPTDPNTGSVYNAAKSGNIQVTFPPTAKNPDRNINLTAPVAGETPMIAIATSDYTGTVTWSPNPPTATPRFAAGTVYTATITLTPRTTGVTLYGVPANYFVVPDTSEPATNPADSGVITAKFPATATTVNLPAIQGVTVPVTGATPVTMITETAQYRGTVTWSLTNPQSTTSSPITTFAAGKAYTAQIDLEAKPGFTLYGVKENYFTVAGTSPKATYAPGIGVITAGFPKTADTVTALNFSVTAPVVGVLPDRNFIAKTNEGDDATTTQYTTGTGIVVWKDKDQTLTGTGTNGQFKANTDYTVEITLSPKTGYTLYGITKDDITVTGTSNNEPVEPKTTNYAYDPITGKGTVSATFTATGP